MGAGSAQFPDVGEDLAHFLHKNNRRADMARTTFVDGLRIPQIRTKRSLFGGFVAIAAMATVLVSERNAEAASPEVDARSAPFVEPLDAASLAEIKTLYKSLIAAENRHDLAAVRPFVRVSPSALFVAKTAT